MTDKTLNEITRATYKSLLKHMNREDLISTQDLVNAAGYDAKEIGVGDMMLVDYRIRKLAQEDEIILDSSYANGLFVGTKYEVPFKIISSLPKTRRS